jgi:FixJ family two-component response regulator
VARETGEQRDPSIISGNNSVREKTGMPRCVVVDDDVSVRTLLEIVLHDLDIDVIQYSHSPDLYDHLISADPDLIILDLSIQEPECWTILEKLQRGPRARMIPLLCTSTLNDVLNRAQRRHRFPGGAIFLEKPFDVHEVEQAVRTLVQA